MPAAKRRTATSKTVMCANHPEVPAAHTTSTTLHQPISLCERCLDTVGAYLRDR